MTAPSIYLSAVTQRQRITPPPAERRMLWTGILLGYGIAFTLLRSSASFWATHELFSLWFPAAGLRFAFLWWAGPRIAPLAALSELLVSVGAGTVRFESAPLVTLTGVVGPCLVYGLVIYIVRRRAGYQSVDAGRQPLPFAIATMLGPIAACVGAMPWALPLAMQDGPINGQILFSALLVFTLGDMLGILVLAPPLLWLFQGPVHHGLDWRFALKRMVGPALVLAASAVLVLVMFRLGYGLQLAPVMLAVGWAGLRGGRAAAFPAIMLSVAVILAISVGGESDVERVNTHMRLACIVATGYLAGSYADAQRYAALEIGRRDRLLYHAERLKTLRAMSVAVIHEVSQPLSTISLEANGMLAVTQSGSPDVGQLRQMAHVIARKAAELSELVRRLRHYGERASSEPASLSAERLIGDVQELAEGEARAAGVRVECSPGPAVQVTCNQIEFKQALLNLLRNAIAAAAAADGVVGLGWTASPGEVSFSFENDVAAGQPRQSGMGVGLMIARGIARAHDGYLAVSQPSPGRVLHSLTIPLARNAQ
jgi:signal transduction histidine kinase